MDGEALAAKEERSGMILTVGGDLLKSDCNILIHQCNCFKAMGGGIAKQIKKRYPEAYEADRNDSREPTFRLGHYTYAYIGREERLIFNLYGQFKYAEFAPAYMKTIYPAFTQGLSEILTNVSEIAERKGMKGQNKIGMPFGIGCGLGKGDWNEIHSIIERISTQHNRGIYLYKLQQVT